jgi:hypothetical protein
MLTQPPQLNNRVVIWSFLRCVCLRKFEKASDCSTFFSNPIYYSTQTRTPFHKSRHHHTNQDTILNHTFAMERLEREACDLLDEASDEESSDSEVPGLEGDTDEVEMVNASVEETYLAMCQRQGYVELPLGVAGLIAVTPSLTNQRASERASEPASHPASQRAASESASQQASKRTSRPDSSQPRTKQVTRQAISPTIQPARQEASERARQRDSQQASKPASRPDRQTATKQLILALSEVHWTRNWTETAADCPEVRYKFVRVWREI